MGKKQKCLFDGNMPIEVVHQKLEIPGAEVRRISDKRIRVTYDRNHFVVDKEKDGYRASVDVPGYLFWALWLLFTLLWFLMSVMNGKGIASAESIVPLFFSSLASALIFAFIFYWITAEIYNSVKKKKLAEYCRAVTGDQA